MNTLVRRSARQRRDLPGSTTVLEFLSMTFKYGMFTLGSVYRIDDYGLRKMGTDDDLDRLSSEAVYTIRSAVMTTGLEFVDVYLPSDDSLGGFRVEPHPDSLSRDGMAIFTQKSSLHPFGAKRVRRVLKGSDFTQS